MKRIFIYRAGDSLGARALARYLRRNYGSGLRVRAWPPGLTSDDLVVAWGTKVPDNPGCWVLNELAPMGDKLDQSLCLNRKGVPSPHVSTDYHDGWYARLHNHHSANDLLRRLPRGDYYVEPVQTVKELRLHVFDNSVFRTALKVPGPGPVHPVFRTDHAGWRLSYDRNLLNQEVPNRGDYYKCARDAVKALGYDFGAVDLGIKADGGPVVFEVNSAPGLEGTTIDSYGQQIINWIKAE